MIKVTIYEKNQYIEKITIIGHANYEIVGKDIVCSAVSSIVTTTVNGILATSDGVDTIKYKVEDGLVTIEVLENDSTTLKLLDNMIDLLNELQNQYKENIFIRKE